MSEPTVIIDTGPLLALLVEREGRHSWASETASKLIMPFITSESVMTEACFLLEREGLPVEPLFELLEIEAVIIGFDLQAEHSRVSSLMARFAKLPRNKSMSLADATLVRLSEIHDRAAVFTFDGDFRIYRKNGRQQIPLIIPESAR